MKFILAPGAVEKFSSLRMIYESENKIDLKYKPSMFAFPAMFGGDIAFPVISDQISFLEKINAILEHFLLKDEEIKTSQQLQAKLIGVRILIAACLYVQERIGSNKEKSPLYRLINQFLGVTTDNFLDIEDKDICYCTAFKLFSQADILIYINIQLRTLGKKEFSRDEWEQFSLFIFKGGDKKDINPPFFPVTRLIQPIFESVFTHTGTNLGGVAAGFFSGSSIAIATRMQLSAWITGTLLTMGPTGAAGAGLMAPAIATGLVSAFCIYSLSALSGRAMGLVGKGAGAVVGLPLDLIYNFIRVSGSILVKYSQAPTSFAPIDGVRLFDGMLMASGNPINLDATTSSLLETEPVVLELTTSGEIIVDGTLLEGNDDKLVLVVRELCASVHQTFPRDEDDYCLIEVPALKKV